MGGKAGLPKKGHDMRPVPIITAVTGAVILAGAGASVGAAADAKKAEPARQCFYQRNITSWHAPDDNTVLLRVVVSDFYKMDMMGPCNGLDFAGEAIGIRNRGGSGYICSGLDVQVLVPDRIPGRCDVSRISKLTKAEVAALPPKSKP